MNGPWRCCPALILVALSCVNSGAATGTAPPIDPDPGEAMRVERSADVEPYVGRRPVVRVKHDAYGAQQPSFDFAVFDDGAVFFEGESCVGDIGLRKGTLSQVALAALKALAEPRCAQLPSPEPGKYALVGCIHGPRAMVSCATTGGDERMGMDCLGSEVSRFAYDLIEKAKVMIWIGTPARRDSSCRSGKRYTATEIDRMLGSPAAR